MPIPPMTDSDGWCYGTPPHDTWLITWVRSREHQTESWTPGIYTTEDCMSEGIPEDREWLFTYRMYENNTIEVLAWRRGPQRPLRLSRNSPV